MHSPIIIAELANAHQGCPDAALVLATSVLKVGAPSIKFQFYTADELLVRTHPRFDHFSSQVFSPSQWKHIITSVQVFDTLIFADVFGLESLDLAYNLGIRDFKVHSSDLTNIPLLNRIQEFRPHSVLLSVGGSTAPEIFSALNHLSSLTNITLMHGFQAYPTPSSATNLARLTWLQDTFGPFYSYGYQDHVDAESPLSICLPLMALSLGASVIEKHVTLDRAAKGVDYFSSLEPSEFEPFITLVSDAYTTLGSPSDSFSEAELHYRDMTRKRLVSNFSLRAGHTVVPDDLTYKRVVSPSPPSLTDSTLLGRRLLVPIAKDQQFTQSLVSTVCWALLVVRTSSSRLSSKALMDIQGRPAILHLIERLKQCSSLDNIVLCTTDHPSDDILEQIALNADIDCHRGPSEDVLQRMLGAISEHQVDVVVRVTGDDLLVDPDYIDYGLSCHCTQNSDYSDLKSLPSGTEVEFFNSSVLRFIHDLANDPSGTEYLTTYVLDNFQLFNINSLDVQPDHCRDWRLTLDTAEDYEVISTLTNAMAALGKATTYRLSDIVDFINQHPEILNANQYVRQRQTPISVDTSLNWTRLKSSSNL